MAPLSKSGTSIRDTEIAIKHGDDIKRPTMKSDNPNKASPVPLWVGRRRRSPVGMKDARFVASHFAVEISVSKHNERKMPDMIRIWIATFLGEKMALGIK